jgi:hypothetical protein
MTRLRIEIDRDKLLALESNKANRTDAVPWQRLQIGRRASNKEELRSALGHLIIFL